MGVDDDASSERRPPGGRAGFRRPRGRRVLPWVLLAAVVALLVPGPVGAQEERTGDGAAQDGADGEEEPEAGTGTGDEAPLDEEVDVDEETGAIEAEQSLAGQLRYRDEDGARQPVVGTSLTVEGVDIEFLETVVTGDEGRYRIGLPEPGDYRVSLDAGTLPEGVDLVDADQETFDIGVDSGEERGVVIRLTAGFEAGEDTTGDRALRLSVDGLRFGLILAMASVGLSLVFGTTGLVNFAHGEVVAFGALTAYLFNQTLGLHLLPAALVAVAVSGLAGACFNWSVWRPLRRRGVGVLGMVITSIGLGLFLRYVYLYQFGGPRRSYDDYAFQTDPVDLGPVSVLPRDLWIMGVSVALLVGVGLALQWTRWGKAIRAVADDRDLAESSGVDVERVITVVWVTGAGLAAVGGIFYALDQQVSWQMGEQLLLLMFSAVILGGVGTAYGALVGGVILGLFYQLSTLVISPEFRLGAALFVLIVVLMVRPQGILGQAERVG